MKPLNYSHEHTIEVSSRRRALFPKDENTSDSDLDCIKSLSSDSESDLDDRQFHSNIDDYDIIGIVDNTASDQIVQQSNGTPQHPKLSNDFVLKETPTQRYNKTPQDAVNPSKLPKLIRNQPKLPIIEKFPIEKNPKVRTALFQEFDMSLSTQSFYPKTTKSPLNSSKLLNAQFIEKKRQTGTKQRQTLYLCNRRFRRKIGMINAGVRHRIKKPRVRQHRDNKAILQAALNILENSPLNDYLSDCNQSIATEDNIVDIENRAPDDIDTNRKFFKSPTRKGIVTVSDNIRVEINNGKMNLIENKKKRPRVQHFNNNNNKNNENQTKRLKVSGQSFDLDNQTETLINTNQIEDLIKTLDEQDNVSENVEKRVKDADLIMSPTSQMCNMTSGLALNSPKRAKNLLPVLDNLPSTSDENKYYPVFYPKKLDVDKKRPLDSSSSSPKNPKKFKQLSKDQMLLDAGQKRFGLTECGECKFIYHLGDPSDEIIHLNYHEARHLFRFNGWRNERIVFNQINNNNNKERIIQITPTDPKLWWKKCKDLLEFVNRDLGFYEMGMNFHETSQVFLYIKNRTIIGILLAEMRQFGYRLLTTHLDQIDLCSEESYPIKCGIARIWVATNHRQQGIGSALMDSLKRNFVYGYLLKNDDIAFSSPTEMGKLFAKSYFKTPNFLIYM